MAAIVQVEFEMGDLVAPHDHCRTHLPREQIIIFWEIFGYVFFCCQIEGCPFTFG
ncbi:hypothetical protein EVA_02330 [gut metagenome]|uniref:Uncharacterized protein n=1 Tax=gut metagenome TaxID=749906 RepID=J9H1G1_9ZZZZ